MGRTVKRLIFMVITGFVIPLARLTEVKHDDPKRGVGLTSADVAFNR